MKPPNEAVLNRATKIYAGLDGIENGEPYLPSNGTEGAIFQSHWCEKCRKDTFDDGGKSCEILLKALMGEQPKQWMYWNGKPLCSAFCERFRPYKPRVQKPKTAAVGEQLNLLEAIANDNP